MSVFEKEIFDKWICILFRVEIFGLDFLTTLSNSSFLEGVE